jgi:hypothetical protein
MVAADVATNHRNLEEGCEFLDLGDAPTVVVPIGEVVSEPVADLSSSPGKGRTGDAVVCQGGEGVII